MLSYVKTLQKIPNIIENEVLQIYSIPISLLNNNPRVFPSQVNGTITLQDLIRTSAHKVSRFPSSAQWDVNRARDHGVASYLKALRLCEPTMNIKSYADFNKLGFDRTQQEMMADMYR